MAQIRGIIPVGMLAVFLTGWGMAQDLTVMGIVVDARNARPLSGADVFLKHAKQGVTTDEDGFFRLQISKTDENDTLGVSFLGYQKWQMALSKYPNRSEIRLVPVSVSEVDSVVVRDERLELSRQEIPHARSVIPYATIELRGSGEISDLFKIIPSVRIEGNDLSGRRIQIRGSDASEVNVYLDGILINNLGINGAADFSMIPVDNIRNLEVLKGANLPLLGGGAFGGVVNITTRKNLEKSLHLKTMQGSFGSQYYLAELNYPLANRWAINYFGQVNGIKPGIEFFPGEALAAQKTENDKIETLKQNHNFSLNYYAKKGEWGTRFFGYALDYDKPSWENRRQNYLWATTYRGELLGWQDLDINVNYQFGNDEVKRQRAADRFLTSFESQRLHVRFLKKYLSNQNEIQLVAEYLHDEVESRTEEARGAQRIPTYNAALYENRWSLAGVVAFHNQLGHYEDVIWKTHIGLRDDLMATGDNYVSPTMGFRIEIDRPAYHLTPYMSYGKNVKIHTLLENAYLELQEIDAGDTTLQRLAPEESSAFEIGVDFSRPAGWFFQKLNFSAAFFRNTIVNKLIRMPGDPSVILSQIGRNITTGVEAALQLEDAGFPRLNLLGSVNYLNISEPFLYPFKPEGMLSLSLDYHTDTGFYLNTTFFLEGKSTGLFPGPEDPNDFVTEFVPSYFDVDAVVGYRFRLGGLRLNLQAAGYNILDNSGYQFYLLRKQFFQVAVSARY